MEDIEKQFFSSYQFTLTQEGKEICKKILVFIGEKDEMMIEKAKVFCEFFLSYKLDGVDTKELIERCEKYINNLNNFNHFKITLKQVNKERRELESWLDMRNMKINGI